MLFRSSGANTTDWAMALPVDAGTNGQFLTTDGSGNTSWATVSGGSGTVTSVDVSGGTTGLTTSGGPVTGSGTITLAGTLAVANGGTLHQHLPDRALHQAQRNLALELLARGDEAAALSAQRERRANDRRQRQIGRAHV